MNEWDPFVTEGNTGTRNTDTIYGFLGSDYGSTSESPIRRRPSAATVWIPTGAAVAVALAAIGCAVLAWQFVGQQSLGIAAGGYLLGALVVSILWNVQKAAANKREETSADFAAKVLTKSAMFSGLAAAIVCAVIFAMEMAKR